MKKRGRPTLLNEEEKRIRALYNSKIKSKKIPFDHFMKWHKEQKLEFVYCGLTSEQSTLLYSKYPDSTRGGRRGKRLEIDSKNPRLDYVNINNLVLACYWRNNAKTNYFTFDEFKKIGEKIKEIQDSRIKSIKKT